MAMAAAAPDPGGVMVKISELASTNEVLADELEDPEFAEEWDRTAFARAVAERVLAYRTEQGLTQTQLARRAGTAQSLIARLESGERALSLATLARLSQRLGIEFHIDITPIGVQLND
jgi:ribosome-binding protein aMBF1 (putative translation factor)